MRTDGVCDAQLRVCYDGDLTGSYGYGSCPSDRGSSVIRRKEYISVNVDHVDNSHDVAVQPSDDSLAPDDRYDLNGKRIDPSNPPADEITGIAVNPPQPQRNVNTQVIYDCQTPWGEVINNGHFVKWYKHFEWYGDNRCQVQLRLCRNGELLGDFAYPSCEYASAY